MAFIYIYFPLGLTFPELLSFILRSLSSAVNHSPSDAPPTVMEIIATNTKDKATKINSFFLDLATDVFVSFSAFFVGSFKFDSRYESCRLKSNELLLASLSEELSRPCH